MKKDTPEFQTIRRLVQAYNLDPTVIHTPQKGYRNRSYAVELAGNITANVIIYKREAGIAARIQRANAVADFLHQQGLPVRHTLERRILCIKTVNSVRYASLYHYLPGTTIPWEAYTKTHLKLTGHALAVMHRYLRPQPFALPHVSHEYTIINSRMQRYFADEPVCRALKAKLGLAVSPGIFAQNQALLNRCHTLPNQQALHMDFVRSNLLFAPATPVSVFTEDNVALSGIIDFEKASHGHPLFDIARTLAFLLVDCTFKTSQQVRRYFLRSGYAKRGGVPVQNIIFTAEGCRLNMLESLLDLFLLYDFYKFLRHNPYESLPANHHFMRTKNILLERRVIQYAIDKQSEGL